MRTETYNDGELVVTLQLTRTDEGVKFIRSVPGQPDDVRDATPEEVALLEVEEQRSTERTINDRLGVALGLLTGHIARPKPATAAAQASAAYDATVLLARVCVGMVRLVLRKLDSAE